MSALGHVFHLIMTIIFFPWIIVWVGCAVSAGNKRRRGEMRMREEELQLLRTIAANQTKGNK